MAALALVLLALGAPLGELQEAQQRVARGECKVAIRALKGWIERAPRSSPEVPTARYLLGLCLLREEDFGEAQRIFADLVTSYPALRDDHRFLRGQALYSWGNKLEAAKVLAEVDPRGPRGEEARRLRARALLEATDFLQLRSWLEDLRDKEGRLEPELSYALGEARAHTLDPRGAFLALREVWREEPSEPFAARALGTIASLRTGGRPLLEEHERAAVRAFLAELGRGRGPATAFADLERRLGAKSELAAEAAYARGRIAENARRLREASEHFDRALRIAPPSLRDVQARSALHRARVAHRFGDGKRAVLLYDEIANLWPERPEAEEALLAAGEIHLAGREYDAAGARLEALLLRSPLTPYRSRCLWGLGWIQYRTGRYEEAQRFFSSLSKLELPSELEAASGYWQGRSEAQLGRLEAARSNYRRVIERHPLSFYAALAEDQLAEALPAQVAAPSASAPMSLPPALAGAEEHLRLGLRDRARQALAEAERNLRRRSQRIDAAALHHLARLYDRAGADGDARRIREEYAREHPQTLSTEELLEATRRSNPVRYEPEIRAAAGEFGISEALFFALVRTESNFQAEAVSAASAYGLAQLILPTAREVAAKIRAGRPSAKTLLTSPKLNLRLGAAYLRELLDRYQGSEPLALAAYNAGPSAVDAWADRRVRPLAGVGAAGKGVGLMPGPDELAEEIPVPETRAYVKTVLARARMYARLVAVPPAPAEPEAPPPPPAVFAEIQVEPASLPPPRGALAEPRPGVRVVSGTRVPWSAPAFW